MKVDLWRNGVNRWHQNPWPSLRNSGDTTDSHCGRMLKLALWLFPDCSRDLLAAIALHDDAEGGFGGIGDVSGPAKVGEYGHAYNGATIKVERLRGTVVELSAHETRALKFIDALDAYRWAALIEPRAMASDGTARHRQHPRRVGRIIAELHRPAMGYPSPPARRDRPLAGVQ